MANVYVDSNAAGAGTGADWTNAYTTLTAAFAAKAAGDNFWVSHAHAESTAGAVTLTSPGTAAAPCTVICVNSAGTVPPVSADLRTTATISTTGANDLTIGGGKNYWYGISLRTAQAIRNAAVGGHHYFTACNWRLTGAAGNIVLGAGAHFYTLDNTTLTFSAVGQSLFIFNSWFTWKNTASAIAGTVPTTLFADAASSGTSNVLCDGVDFSAVAAGKTLVGAFSTNKQQIIFKDCQFSAAVGTLLTTPTGIEDEIYLVRSDSSGTNYRHEKWDYQGTQTVETTIIRTGGASDGTTAIAWKIVTTANSKWILPFECIPMAIWNNNSAANVTVTVYGIWGGGAVPNNDDIWIEVSYLGSASVPLATINTANSKADYLAVAAAQTTDTSTWGGSTTKFKMSVTLSSPQPAQKGMLYVTVKAAKTSSTFYIDPLIALS